MKYLLCILCLFIFSCDSGGDENIYTLYESYPLNVDNYWIYVGTLDFLFSDESKNKSLTERDTVTIVDIVSDTNNVEVYKLKIESSQISDDDEIDDYYGEGYQYYQNHEDGLYHYGYESAGASSWIFPKEVSKLYKIGNQLLSYNQLLNIISLFKRESITWDDNPLQSIKYPVSFNSTWNFREEGEPFKMDKQIISHTDTSFTIQTLYGDDLQEENNDFLIDVKHVHSLNGLVSYSLEISGISVSDEFGNPTNEAEYLTLIANFNLIDCNID